MRPPTLLRGRAISEMTQTYGQSFGGTFSENDEETYSYDGPQKGLGFRCIAELIE